MEARGCRTYGPLRKPSLVWKESPPHTENRTRTQHKTFWPQVLNSGVKSALQFTQPSALFCYTILSVQIQKSLFFFAFSHASWKETRLPPMTFPLPDWRWVLFPLPRGNATGPLLLLETGGSLGRGCHPSQRVVRGPQRLKGVK